MSIHIRTPPEVKVCDVMLSNSSVATTPPEDAVNIKSFPSTPTKKARRRPFQMDPLTPAKAEPESSMLTPPTPETPRSSELSDAAGTVLQPTSKGIGSEVLSPSRIFACGQCGKCFVSLKYLDMHAASLHVGKWNTARDVIVVEPASMATVAIRHPFCRPSSGATTFASFVSGVDAAVTVTESRPPVSALFPVRPPTLAPPASGLPVASTTSASSAARSTRNNEWKCATCQKTFSQNSSFKNHQRTHSDERPFVCIICSIGFKERYHLKKHVLFKHTDELREQCRVCGKRFKDTTAVRAHERIHSDLRPYACQRCHKAFKTSECLWHHENRSKSCGGLGGVVAAVAPPLSSSSSSKDDEVQVRAVGRSKRASKAELPSGDAHEPGNFSVTLQFQSSPIAAFGSMADTTSGDGDHVIFDELQTAAMVDVVDSYRDDATVSPQSNLPYSVKPEVCFATSDGSNLRDGLVLLADCAVRAPETEAPLSNKRVKLPNAAQPSTPMPPPLQVKVEPEVVLTDYELTAMTSSESSFYERMREMTSESETILETDDSPRFSTGSVNKKGDPRRQEVGLASRRLMCNRCGRQFSSIKAYDRHVVIHSESRPYTCDKCQVGFKLKVHLKKHVLYRHSNDYHCSCRHCGKKFKDSSAVRLHERIHSTERPFGCSSCGKTFKTRENLWGHRHRGPCGMATVHPSVASSGQTSDTSPEGLINMTLQAAAERPCSTTAVGVAFVTTQPEVSWPSGHVISPGVPLTDDWIAKLLAATAAASRRSANDVTPPDCSTPSPVLGGGVGSAAIMTAAEQQALLNKAIILSRLLQSQRAASGRQLFQTAAGIITTASTPSGSGFISSLPTAVVTPMKRKTPDPEDTSSAATVVSINHVTVESTVTTASSSATVVSSTPQQLSPTSLQMYSSAGKAHLPPIETFRAYHQAPVGALSQSEAVPPEVNTSVSSAMTAVNLSLHSAVSATESAKPGNELAGTQLSTPVHCRQPETAVNTSSALSRDSPSFLFGASKTLRRIAHAHISDAVRRTAAVIMQGSAADDADRQRHQP